MRVYRLGSTHTTSVDAVRNQLINSPLCTFRSSRFCILTPAFIQTASPALLLLMLAATRWRAWGTECLLSGPSYKPSGSYASSPWMGRSGLAEIKVSHLQYGRSICTYSLHDTQRACLQRHLLVSVSTPRARACRLVQ